MRWALLIAVAGCYSVPEATPLRDELQVVEVSSVWSTTATESWFPTDVEVRPGGLFILDGYRGQGLHLDNDHNWTEVVGDPQTWGRPIRSEAAIGGGWWLVEAGRLLRVDFSGELVAELTPKIDDEHFDIVSVLDTGDRLWVSDLVGSLFSIDRDTGEGVLLTDRDVDDLPLGVVVDLQLTDNARVLATDTVQARVHVLDLDGAPLSWIGGYGPWTGTLVKPKSAAPGPGNTIVVADSAQGLLQVFDPDGLALGVVASEGSPLVFEHPIAVRRVDATHFAAIDATTSTVWGFELTEEALETARETAPARRLRQIAAERTLMPSDGTLCIHCHDGLLNDDREVWDEDLGHHPRGTEVERELPWFLPLGPDGELQCTTCHSPHGISSIDQPGEGHARSAEPLESTEAFMRMNRRDSTICIACHEEAPHEAIQSAGTAHPSGRDLLEALEERQDGTDGVPEGIRAGCLGCHAMHGAADGVLAAFTTDGSVCVRCHEAESGQGRNHTLHTHSADLPDRDKLAGLPIAPGGALSCMTCHDLVGGQTEALIRKPIGVANPCYVCHEDQKRRTFPAHLKAKTVGCLGCHDPHDNRADHLLTTVSEKRTGDPTGCRSCHDDKTGRVGHPVNEPEPSADPLECTSCHGSVHKPRKQATACASCHDKQEQARIRGGHGDALCTSCHSAHQAVALSPAHPGLNPGSRRCLTCHGAGGDATQVEEFEHAEPVFLPDGDTRWTPLGLLPLFDKQGKPVPAGENGALTCSSCHATHGPDATKPGDNLRLPRWKEACSACHGDDSLALYRYFHEPSRRANLEVGPPKDKQ